MKKCSYLLIIIFINILLSSCSSLLFTTLDVLRPAQVAFPPEINNLLIVNNTPQDSIQPSKKSFTKDSLSIYCLSSLTEELINRGFFQNVLLELNSLNKTQNDTSIYYLTPEVVTQLCSNYKSDAILALNKLKETDILTEYFVEDENSFLSTFEVFIETYWSIHYPDKTEFTTLQFKDSMYWESENYSRQAALDQLPNKIDAQIDAALYAGRNSVKRFVPYWEKVDRYFFNPRDKLMRQAMDSVYYKNWEDAIQLWDKAIQTTKNTKLQAQAANNIAIAYEILGDLDKAIEYATLSLKSFLNVTTVDKETITRISNYRNELIKRKEEIEQLEIQLGE